MRVSFSPVRSEGTLSVSVSGDTVTINGEAFNFARVQEGDTLPASAVSCPALASDVVRLVEQIHITLTLPHGKDPAHDVSFPEDVIIGAGDVIAPGLTAPSGPVTPGVIDWTALVTPQIMEAERLTAWRESRHVAKTDLMLALYCAGMISEASAMSRQVPAEFAPVVNAMPEPPRSEIRIRWAHLTDVGRMNQLITYVQAALGWPDAQVDALFGWEG